MIKSSQNFIKCGLMIKILNNFIYRITTLPALNTHFVTKLYSTNVSHWKNINYNIKFPLIITKSVIKIYINKFWSNVMDGLLENQYILFILRVTFIDNQNKSLCKALKLGKENKKQLIDFLIDRFGLMNEAYKSTQISSITISYRILEGNFVSDLDVDSKNKIYHTFYKNKLPIGYKPEDYGLILNHKNNFYLISIMENIIMSLDQINEHNQIINLCKYFKKNKVLFEWKDIIVDSNNIIREIGKSIYHFKDGEIILIKILKQTKPIQPTNLDKNLSNNIITMDLETILINNVHVPYLLCWYDGLSTHSYFIKNLNDNNLENNILDIITKAMNDICKRKYKNYQIYLHNFSKFDGYFLVKYLAKIGIVDAIINDGKIITINYTHTNGYSIRFKDSYLLLPSSLRKLCNFFKVETQKGIFPYLYPIIDYFGLVPSIIYFQNVSNNEYNSYVESFKNKIWNFKDEAIKYCNIDCISLYQILIKFNNLIFNKFSLNINRYPTLPSLSFGIWRTHYIPHDKDKEGKIIQLDNTNQSVVHKLSGVIANDIRLGYTGGAVDMYIPRPPKGLKIFGYDVNSLYPSQMLNFDMPVGTPNFTSNINLDDRPFGFFYCEIVAPDNLKQPIIQTHVNTENGMRTIAPLGYWNDMWNNFFDCLSNCWNIFPILSLI